MYLFWKNTTLGSIRLSREGLTEFIDSLLLPSYSSKEVALSRMENSLYIVLSLPQPHNALEVKMVEEKLQSSFADLGLGVHISWTEEKITKDKKKIPEILQNPLSWVACTAGITALIHMRIKGILWTVAVSALTFVVAQFLLSEHGQKLIDRCIDYIRKIIRR